VKHDQINAFPSPSNAFRKKKKSKKKKTPGTMLQTATNVSIDSKVKRKEQSNVIIIITPTTA